MILFEQYKAKNLITTSGKKQLEHIPWKQLVIHIFLGENPRDFLEHTIKSRVLSNFASTLELFLNDDLNVSPDNYVDLLKKDFKNCNNTSQRMIPLWAGGLTSKGFDNIARKDFDSYCNSLEKSLERIPIYLEEQYGPLSGFFSLNNKFQEITWYNFVKLSLFLFAQSLTIKGSEKSASGKIWEKLVLGSILTILGFKKIDQPNYEEENVFWLSHEDQDEREIDATIVLKNQIICIDIGFIGIGNPEISLDKVTRFKNQIELNKKQINVSTIIIVDTLYEKSGIFNKAKGYNANIIQMNSNNWTKELANILINISNDNIPNSCKSLAILDDTQLKSFFENELNKLEINTFL